ncbi:MAG TPA: ornithine cyclodeaminase family protein [Blastocatellia bacterium]|nr:ornithine cyclodeaminase family protein [Blastocatellia bacterium]
MKILVLNQSGVEELLPIRECIPVMEEALASLARGDAHQPLRMIIQPPGAAGDMALMPSYRAGERAAYGLKAVCFFAGNTVRGLDSHQGGVMLFSADTGELLALMNASAITAIRTAAVSGVATKLLAREDASELAIIGSGVQARAHLEAMSCVRAIKRARVASLTFDHARRFAERLRSDYAFPIEPVDSVEAAVRDADVIVTATTADHPIVQRAWISEGTHLNVVGSSIPTTREMDTATMAAASLFVDRRESTLNEGGDYLFAMREGAIGPEHIRAEIGELLTGMKAGRTSPEEITLFKSLGLAIEDLASADYLYRKAQETRSGTWVEF